MNTIILIGALIWPQPCVDIGDLYYQAALIRDIGTRFNDALDKTKSDPARLALIHVYERRDMSAEGWRYFAMGTCVGSQGRGMAVKRPERMM